MDYNRMKKMEVEQMVEDNKLYKKEIFRLEERIYIINKTVMKNNKTLWKECKHKWVDQQDSCMYEKSTERCIKCYLTNDSRLYN
tara:strand:- start:1502 stop:1753 length:252 start_codon:yes stop_codon:yes gene_type:complete